MLQMALWMLFSVVLLVMLLVLIVKRLVGGTTEPENDLQAEKNTDAESKDFDLGWDSELCTGCAFREECPISPVTPSLGKPGFSPTVRLTVVRPEDSDKPQLWMECLTRKEGP
jgi:hypothetical protein